MWMTFFIISFVVNTFLLYYIRWLLTSFKELQVDVESTETMIKNFVLHIDSIYELEMFYGDETLKLLLDHGKEITEKLSEIDFLLDPSDEDAFEEEPTSEQ